MDKQVIFKKIERQVKEYPILIYMKGTPEFPQCGFSSKACQILNSTGIPFGYVNIFDEPEIRQYLPEYSSWPTFPQIFINAEFIGGGDILSEMHEDAELQNAVEKAQLLFNEKDSNL